MSQPSSAPATAQQTAADPAAASSAAGNAASAASAQPSSTRVTVDESNMATQYANFCRVTGTPEELLIDFGLNAQPTGGQAPERIELDQRVVVNYYTAKRLMAALNMAIQRHEGLFGEIETNPQKRLKQTPANS